MEKKILIITSTFDRTCDFLIAKYHDIDFFRLNTDDFFSYEVSYSENGFILKDRHDKIITSYTCKSIYYRKPAPQPLVNKIDEKYWGFVHRECMSFIEGIADSFEGVCLSPPAKMKYADNKLVQAKVGHFLGFNIPEFVIGNHNPFDSSHQKRELEYIVKPLASGMITTGNKKEIVQTNIYAPHYPEENLKYSPVYFQLYQSKDYETRITIVNQKFFSVKITSKNQVDWRKTDNSIIYEIIETPEIIQSKCLRYMRYFGLNFGCFDFIVKNNTWYFLEMNANGQWLWLELETGVKI
ncbi:TPA: hypothetical protein MNA18_005343, partial [Citrobacter freundii]|nr:hypothetical protein [Citrobacter freundii]